MKNYKIIKTKYDITEGGIACGFVPGYGVSSIEFECDNKIQYLSIIDVESMPLFYLTDDEIFDNLVNEIEDDEFLYYRDNHEINEFEGIDLNSHEYYDIYKSLNDNKDSDGYALIKYAIAITRLDEDQIDELIEESEGKFVNEIDIPETEDEEEYNYAN